MSAQLVQHSSRLHSLKEVMEITGHGRTTIYGLAAKGVITLRKAGGRTVVHSRDLEAYLDSLPEFIPQMGGIGRD